MNKECFNLLNVKWAIFLEYGSPITGEKYLNRSDPRSVKKSNLYTVLKMLTTSYLLIDEIRTFIGNRIKFFQKKYRCFESFRSDTCKRGIARKKFNKDL